MTDAPKEIWLDDAVVECGYAYTSNPHNSFVSQYTRTDTVDTVQQAAEILLAEHQRCAAIPVTERTMREDDAAHMGRNRLKRLATARDEMGDG